MLFTHTMNIMTKKNLKLLPGTIASHLRVTAIALVLAGMPMLAAQAQTSPAPAQPATPRQQPAQNANPNQGGRIQVTPAQKAEIDKIQQAALSQIQAVLTKEQKTQLDEAQKNGVPLNRVSVNLSQEQSSKIRTIVNDADRQIIERVLTPEQRNQLMRSNPQAAPQSAPQSAPQAAPQTAPKR
jgi:periplasmic protein CpxP/Spy